MATGFSLKNDYELALSRHEAFFNREVIGRPPVLIRLQKPGYVPLPDKQYASLREQWLDIDYRAERISHRLSHTDFLYEALPIAFPDMGPSIFSVWCGCEVEFGEDTAWARPCIMDWRDAGKARLDKTHPLFETTVRFTEELIQRGAGRFIVALTDFHPGGDHAAALRGAAQLNMDLIDAPEQVDTLLQQAEDDYFDAYGVFCSMVRKADMPVTTWLPLAHDGLFYVPCNDFSCMVSKEMFDRHFLPGIARECAYYERNIYHLDGPGALRHLDSILAIPGLNAVQWVPGTGNEGFVRWCSVYRKIQAAGKGIYMSCDASEIGDITSTLSPEGVCFGDISGITDCDSAAVFVKRVEKWQ